MATFREANDFTVGKHFGGGLGKPTGFGIILKIDGANHAIGRTLTAVAPEPVSFPIKASPVVIISVLTVHDLWSIPLPDIAGTVASMTEGDPGGASERASHHALG